MITTFFDGYCSTVQGLLDWFEVDLGFTELSFIQIDLCVHRIRSLDHNNVTRVYGSIFSYAYVSTFVFLYASTFVYVYVSTQQCYKIRCLDRVTLM